jgi:hypothetical protein
MPRACSYFHLAEPRELIMFPLDGRMRCSADQEVLLKPLPGSGTAPGSIQYYVAPIDAAQEDLLPPAVWAVRKHPLHWRATQGLQWPLTPRRLAIKLLVAVFKALHPDVQAIGYYLAVNGGAARARQPSRSQPFDYGAWWAGWRAQHGASMQDRQGVLSSAAMALFSNPPVCWHKGFDATASSSSSSTPPPKHLLHNACMVVCQKKNKCSYMKLVAGYPTMVLGNALSGAQITIKVAHLVVWLFHGPKDNPSKIVVVPPITRLQQPGEEEVDDLAFYTQQHKHKLPACTVCCHVDVGDTFVKWHRLRYNHPRGYIPPEHDHTKWPMAGRCFSSCCASPCCVFWGTQSINAMTKTKRNLQARKQHKKM